MITQCEDVAAATRASRIQPFRSRPVRLIAGLVTALVLGACGGDGSEGGGAAEAVEPDPAPAYRATTLEGDTARLADLGGEVVLLNVWATWCTPCRQEIPELQALHEKHASEGLRVVGVTVDSRSAEAEVRRFIDEFGMTYEVWWDPDQTAVSTFEAIGVPLTVLIDRDGKIVWRHLGAFQRGDPELLRAVETALSAGSGASEAAS